MAAPGVVLNHRIGPFDGRLGGDFVRRFGAVTGSAPDAVPPCALVTRIWEAENEAREALVPAELRRAASGGVHGEHDLVLHRPLEPDEDLRTWVEGHGARPAGRNSLVTLRYTTLDRAGAVVAEQWWTTVWLGVVCEPAGASPPDHALPAESRARPAGATVVDIEPDLARRYAEVSGDWSAHHFEAAAAQRSGYDRPFLHGLCTMALCSEAATAHLAGGDATRIRRVAVRFARPAFLGESLSVAFYDAAPSGYAFEAVSAGTTVISRGRLILE